MRIRETINPPVIGEPTFAQGETIREGRLRETWLTIPHPTMPAPWGILRLEAIEEGYPPHLLEPLKAFALWLLEEDRKQQAAGSPPHPPRPQLVR